jgi:hypothetical protein
MDLLSKLLPLITLQAAFPWDAAQKMTSLANSIIKLLCYDLPFS